MGKPEILILTSAFPYLPGEYFFEDEIPYWEATELFGEITIMPWSVEGIPRKTSERIKIDKPLHGRPPKWIRCLYCIQCLFYSFLYKEILWLAKEKKLTVRNLYRMLACASGAIITYNRLRKFLRGKTGCMVYAYWNDAQAYGAALAKRAGLIDTLVSRAHGFDLYKARRPDSYMPLKRQFAGYFDTVFVLSGEAEGYMQKAYGIPPEALNIAPLGVPLPPRMSSPGDEGEVNIVSVAFCRPVKRMDKIIGAVAAFAGRNPSLRVNWQHIGGGALLDEIKELARLRLTPFANVTFYFHGTIPNGEVKAFYLQNKTDIFINTSESEGIPVSMIEAMAAGVPPLAPDVGGISDLVSNEFGILTGENPSVEEIADAIGELMKKARRLEIRQKARERVESRFNAAKNYPEFIKRLHALAAGKGGF